MLPETVLLVDDEALVLDVLSLALKKTGLAVHTALSATAALARAHDTPFGCALIDTSLPDGSGLELIETLRGLQPGCACVVMTGYPNADAILKAMKLGAVDYLEKPFPDLAVVKEKVVRLVQRQRAVVERDALLQRVQELERGLGQEDFRETTEIALLQQALEGALQESQRVRSAVTAGAASLQTVLSRHALPHDAARTVGDVLRLLEGASTRAP